MRVARYFNVAAGGVRLAPWAKRCSQPGSSCKQLPLLLTISALGPLWLSLLPDLGGGSGFVPWQSSARETRQEHDAGGMLRTGKERDQLLLSQGLRQ